MPSNETEPKHEDTSKALGACGVGPCNAALESPKRLGRAHYVCRECGKDITLALVMLMELEDGTRSS